MTESTTCGLSSLLQLEVWNVARSESVDPGRCQRARALPQAPSGSFISSKGSSESLRTSLFGDILNHLHDVWIEESIQQI